MNFENAYEYLEYKYSKTDHRKEDISELDFYAIFSKARHIYGYENEDLYNTDKSLFRQINKINKELILPIEEQDRSSYWLLKRHSENIESVLKVNNINIPNDIVLGTLPTDELNAVVGIFPKNQILIAFCQDYSNSYI